MHSLKAKQPGVRVVLKAGFPTDGESMILVLLECLLEADKRLLTLNFLYHTFPHELCRCEVKDVHGLQFRFDTF